MLSPGVCSLPAGTEAAPIPSVEVSEVPLLMPGWQVEALEELAHARGLTAAEMVRRLVTDFILRSAAL